MSTAPDPARGERGAPGRHAREGWIQPRLTGSGVHGIGSSPRRRRSTSLPLRFAAGTERRHSPSVAVSLPVAPLPLSRMRCSPAAAPSSHRHRCSGRRRSLHGRGGREVWLVERVGRHSKLFFVAVDDTAVILMVWHLTSTLLSQVRPCATHRAK